MNAEIEQIFIDHLYVNHICIFAPGSEDNRSLLWLATGESGTTPYTGTGKTPAEAITDLRISLEVV